MVQGKGTLPLLVNPTKSVYYALSVAEDKDSGICPGLELLKFPKNKDFAGCMAWNSVLFRDPCRSPAAPSWLVFRFRAFEDASFNVQRHHRSSC
jgi:hypothetical protein